MPNLNVPFAGQTLILSGSYYSDNVNAALPTTPPTTPPLVYIGYSYGQKPFTAQTYGSAPELLAAIRGGPASGFVTPLVSPSAQLNGAQQITFINASQNTQSSFTMNSSGQAAISVTSTNYGPPSNLLQVQVQTGTVGGSRVSLFDSFAGLTYAQDNLGIPFQLSYLGAAVSGVTYAVSGTAGAASVFKLISPNPGESINIPLTAGNYSTVEQVVQYINGTSFYSANLISQGDLPSASLDILAGAALSSGSTSVTAILSDPVFWLNNHAGALTTAVIASGAVSVPASGLTNIPFQLFSGAVGIPPVLNDYATAFNLALTLPGFVVFADSNASGVVALGTQHAVTASSAVNGRFRRFFAGSSLGDSVTQVISAARGQNAITSTYVYPGIFVTDTNTGINTLQPGHYCAAAAAAMACGNTVATPLTNKSLTGNGVEVALTTTQIDQLQQGGVMPIALSTQTGVPTIISDFTTWQNDANPENVFNQQVACRQYLGYSLNNVLSPYVGTIADQYDETRILNAAKACLNALLYKPGGNGILNSWDATSLTLVFTGANQLAAVQVNVVLVGQNRFITEYVSIQPLNITISNAA